MAGAIAIVRAIAAELTTGWRLRAEAQGERLRLQQERIKADAEAMRLRALRATAFRTRATTFLLALVILAFAWAIVTEITTNTIIVEPFSVPPELAQRGYTPEVVADRIRDAMSASLDDLRNGASEPGRR